MRIVFWKRPHVEGLKPVKAWWVSLFWPNLHWEPLYVWQQPELSLRTGHKGLKPVKACWVYQFWQSRHWKPWILSCLLAHVSSCSHQFVILSQQCLWSKICKDWVTLGHLIMSTNIYIQILRTSHSCQNSMKARIWLASNMHRVLIYWLFPNPKYKYILYFLISAQLYWS